MLDALAHYKVLDRLGTGDLGEMYRARDTRLGRTVALKLPPESLVQDPSARKRFLQDARMATALSHPNIAAVYEVGEDRGRIFLACEFVPGETVRTAMGGHALNPRRAIDVAAQIADALADGHAAGIVHGSVDPEHIVVTPKGNAKLLDFGLSSWADGTGGANERKNYRADVVALGRVLSEMLTGSPVDGPMPPSTSVAGLPPELDAIVVKALDADSEDGYQSAATLAAELRSVGAILDVRSGVSEPVSLAAAPGRGRGGLVVAAVVVVLLALGVWLLREPAMRFWRNTLGPPPEPVVAVLPLRLETADQDETFFADGLSEDLARHLAEIPGVRVLGRFGLPRDRGRSPNEVAAELGARVVLTGSVRPQASPLTITLELVDAGDGRTIWTKSYTRDPSEIFAVQAEASEDLAAALRVPVVPSAARVRAAARVVDPAAYRAYLRGLQAADQRRFADAVVFLQQAADADAGLAEAFAWLALSIDASDIDNVPADEERIAAAAARAYQLDPDLPEANAAMALATPQLAEALRYLRHAVDVDPSWGDGYRRIADRIREVDPVRAAAFYRTSLDLDPRLDSSRAGLALAEDLAPPAEASVTREEIQTALDGLLGGNVRGGGDRPVAP